MGGSEKMIETVTVKVEQKKAKNSLNVLEMAQKYPMLMLGVCLNPNFGSVRVRDMFESQKKT